MVLSREQKRVAEIATSVLEFLDAEQEKIREIVREIQSYFSKDSGLKEVLEKEIMAAFRYELSEIRRTGGGADYQALRGFLLNVIQTGDYETRNIINTIKRFIALRNDNLEPFQEIAPKVRNVDQIDSTFNSFYLNKEKEMAFLKVVIQAYYEGYPQFFDQRGFPKGREPFKYFKRQNFEIFRNELKEAYENREALKNMVSEAKTGLTNRLDLMYDDFVGWRKNHKMVWKIVSEKLKEKYGKDYGMSYWEFRIKDLKNMVEEIINEIKEKGRYSTMDFGYHTLHRFENYLKPWAKNIKFQIEYKVLNGTAEQEYTLANFMGLIYEQENKKKQTIAEHPFLREYLNEKNHIFRIKLMIKILSGIARWFEDHIHGPVSRMIDEEREKLS